MEYRKKLILVALALLPVLTSKADIADTVINLDKVVIKGLKFNSYSIGTKVYSIDTLALKIFSTGSLADVLQIENSVSVKTYGPGGMASVSVRGGSSRHTAVIWRRRSPSFTWHF